VTLTWYAEDENHHIEGMVQIVGRSCRFFSMGSWEMFCVKKFPQVKDIEDMKDRRIWFI
jgi:hypothetical protein